MPNRDFNQLKQDVKEVAILMFAKNLAKDSINGNRLAALFYDAADKATDLYDTAAERCDWDGILSCMIFIIILLKMTEKNSHVH